MLAETPIPRRFNKQCRNQVARIPLDQWMKQTKVERAECFDGGHYIGLKGKSIIVHSTLWGTHRKTYTENYEARRTFERVSVSYERMERWLAHAKGLVQLDTMTPRVRIARQRLRNLQSEGWDLSGLTDEEKGEVVARQRYTCRTKARLG